MCEFQHFAPKSFNSICLKLLKRSPVYLKNLELIQDVYILGHRMLSILSL